MATIQTINTGSSPNSGDGDPLRTAGTKANSNFAALNTETMAATTKLAGIEAGATADQTAAEVPVTESGIISGNVQTSLEALLNAIPNGFVLTATAVSGAVDAPVSQTWRRYSNSGGFLVVLSDAFADGGEAILHKLAGAGTGLIVAGGGKTLNGATGAADSTEVTDLVAGSSSGADVTFTSAGTNLPDLDAGDYFELRSHSTAALNGWYVATGSPSTSSLPATKIANSDGSTPLIEPEDATSETADVDQPVEDGHHLESVASIKRIGSDFLVGPGTDAPKAFDGSNLVNFGDAVSEAGELYGQLSPWQDGTGSFAGAPSGRSWNVIGNITAVPVANGWWGKFRNVSGSGKTIALASGTFVSMADGSTGTLTLGDDRACVLHCDGTNAMVDGVVALA